MRSVAKVAVAAANLLFDKPYSYVIQERDVEKAAIGKRVIVPFGKGNRKTEGLIIAFGEDNPDMQLKAIDHIDDESEVLDEDMLRLAFWLRKRCYCSLYDIIRCMVPSAVGAYDAEKTGKRRKYISLAVTYDEALQKLADNKRITDKQRAVTELLKSGRVSHHDCIYQTGISKSSLARLVKIGIATITEEGEYRSPLSPSLFGKKRITAPALSPEQTKVYKGLERLAHSDKAECALLHGITGSGKTHVYIELISDVVKRGKSAIMLVPEIALTPQMLERFYTVFGDRIAVIHSALSDGERNDEWVRIKKGIASIVIGTRSAVFAPIATAKLGVIIIDEEQEYSYKSENSPRYSAIDVAKYRAAKSKSLLLLGSATPSVESSYAAETGRYSYFKLESRFNDASLAETEIVDRKSDLRGGNDNAIGSVLMKEIIDTASKGEQTILFLNRRGRNRRLLCTECGKAVECPNCTSAMSYHSANNRMMCHICGYSTETPLLCPSCGSRHLILDKAGTQKIEEELEEAAPELTYIRMDADTTGSRYAHEDLLTRFKNENINVLLGTQMITKGLDFENVTLVGVLDADMSLYTNDFRAAERTFSLLTQVVGRAGRGKKHGKALIQSMTPNNEILLAASKQDYDRFYRNEIEIRKSIDLPPFCDLVYFTISGLDERNTTFSASRLEELLIESIGGNANLLGPVPAGVYKISNRYRYCITLKTHNLSAIRDKIYNTVYEFLTNKENKDIQLTADENPYDM